MDLGDGGLEQEVADVGRAEIEERRHHHNQGRMWRVFGDVEHDTEAVVVVYINRRLVTCGSSIILKNDEAFMETNWA